MTENSPHTFHEGDMAVILRKDGQVIPICVGVDAEGLKSRDESTYTDEDRETLERGEKLFALAFAASTPMIMDLLLQIVKDPDVVSMEQLGQRFDRPN